MVATGPNRDKVYATVLEPMTTLYKPPPEIAKSAERVVAVLDQYADALAGFSEEVLSRAYVQVRDEHRYPTWPAIAVYVGAAKSIEATRSARKGGDAGDTHWITRARRMQEAFMAEYERSPLARQALAEGWYYIDLRRFVWRVSNIQAQLLAQEAAFGRMPRCTGDPAFREEYCIEAMRRAGAICVEVPEIEIRKWRAWAQHPGAKGIAFDEHGNVLKVIYPDHHRSSGLEPPTIDAIARHVEEPRRQVTDDDGPEGPEPPPFEDDGWEPDEARYMGAG